MPYSLQVKLDIDYNETSLMLADAAYRRSAIVSCAVRCTVRPAQVADERCYLSKIQSQYSSPIVAELRRPHDRHTHTVDDLNHSNRMWFVCSAYAGRKSTPKRGLHPAARARFKGMGKRLAGDKRASCLNRWVENFGPNTPLPKWSDASMCREGDLNRLSEHRI